MIIEARRKYFTFDLYTTFKSTLLKVPIILPDANFNLSPTIFAVRFLVVQGSIMKIRLIIRHA